LASAFWRCFWPLKEPTGFQTANNRSRLLVFFETLVAMYIIVAIANGMGNNVFVIVAYAQGNSIGTYINLEKVPF